MPAIIAHAERLTEERTFSHFRAVCLAFESIGDKAAASILFELLNCPGIRSDAVTSYRQASKEYCRRQQRRHLPAQPCIEGITSGARIVPLRRPVKDWAPPYCTHMPMICKTITHATQKEFSRRVWNGLRTGKMGSWYGKSLGNLSRDQKNLSRRFFVH
jgi:hypothetical protein